MIRINEGLVSQKVEQNIRKEWTEREFEKWFKGHFSLPGDEPILLIAKHRPMRRVVDLVGIDAEGGLVILEVKNEKTSRRAIGQALEYLSHYENISVDALAEEFQDENNRDLGKDFRNKFKQELRVSRKRRVYLIAPGHDLYAAVCASYLSRHLVSAKARFLLAVATRTRDGFELTICPTLPARRPCDFPQKKRFGLSLRHSLYLILGTGSQAVLWHLGKLDPTTEQLVPRKRVSLRLLRHSQQLLIPCKQQMNVESSERVWLQTKRKNMIGKEIGRLVVNAPSSRPVPGTYVFLALFDQQKTFRRFQRIPLKRFIKEWVVYDCVLPDWRVIAQDGQRKHLQKVNARKAKRTR